MINHELRSRCKLTISNKSHGFALFETAIALVVASGLLTSYQNQQVNKKLVSDILSYSKPSQQAIADYYNKNGSLPTNKQQAQLPNGSKIEHPAISNFEVGEFGEIIITLSPSMSLNSANVTKKTIILEPRVGQGKITWSCNNGSLENHYRPKDCLKDQAAEEKNDSEMLKFISEGNYL